MSRAVARAQADIDKMIEQLAALRRALPELERRTRYSAGGDGYPGGSMGGGGTGAIGRPTERAALTRPPADPVRIWTREALQALQAAGRSIAAADGRRRLVLDSGGLSPDAGADERVCHNPDCQATTTDPLRDGLCPPCYQWRRRKGTQRPGRRVSA